MAEVSNIPTNMKSPPVYIEGNSYEEWKRDIEMWKLLKAATDTEEGPLVYRTLYGRGKSAVSDLTPAQVGSATGLQLIIERLDKIYLPEANQRIFSALDMFEKFKRPASMSMTNFILQFENLHNRVKTHKVSYPDGVLAYRLLVAANLSAEREALCRATVETGKWTYQAVLDQLNKIFSSTHSENNNSSIKVESTFHATSNQPYHNEHENYYYEDTYQDENSQELENPPDYDPYLPNNNSHLDPSYQTYPENHDVYFTPSTQKYNNSRFRNPSYPNQYNSRRPFLRRPPPRSFPNQRPPYSPNFTNSRAPTSAEFKSLKSQYSTDPCTANPKDAKGNYTICRRCRSIYHWISDCPHIPDSQNTLLTQNLEQDIYIALLQSSYPMKRDQITQLVSETLGKAVLDSGCSKTVAGQYWFEDYKNTLSEEEKSEIKYEESNSVFRFGDSKPINSLKRVLLPVYIGEHNIMLVTEIVPSDVPLLLSKDTLKSLEGDLSFKDDSFTIFGETFPVICTKSGHYAIPISKNPYSNIETETPNKETVELALMTVNIPQPKEAARKLHQQFCHPSSDRLIKFLKTAGSEDENLFDAIKEYSSKCDTCKRYMRSRPRPAVCFPLAKEFNETVGIDLKIFENNKIYFMHIVDHLTRFSAASVIRSKKPQIIIDNVFKHWISIFGAPQKLISDNGGEFANAEFVDLCENLNIRFTTTAAEAPWSNGLVEKQNDILGEAVSKILEEVDCSVEVALCWAVNSKNSLQNIYGYSPYQLVFGRNPNLPTILNSKLPALEGVTGSQLVAQHLNAMHKAREEYVKLESSERLRRALKARMRTHDNTKYLSGDEVFFKRENEKRWRAGRVMGQDGSKVLIKTPDSFVTVHTSRVTLTSATEEDRVRQENELENDQQKPEPTNINPEHAEEENDHSQTPPTTNDNVDINKTEENRNIPEIREEVAEENTLPVVPNPMNNLPVTNPEPVLQQNETNLPKINQTVKYRLNDSENWKNVKILNRAGKVGKNKTGKYKNWLNVRNLDNNVETSIDWSEVGDWEPLEFEVLNTLHEDKFSEARKKELDNWKSMDVYEEVEDNNQKAISVRWVYKEKLTDEGTLQKARLVAKGFQEDKDDIGNDSPTCGKDSLRVTLAISSAKSWNVNSIDIKAAFLQSHKLERTIYLRPPKEANAKGKLWRLNKPVYGLMDASRQWYIRFRDELLKANCKCSKIDPAVFYYYYSDNLEGMIISHVDDLLWSGTDNFQTNVVKVIKSAFQISKENSEAFKYLGLEIYHDQNGIHVTQDTYSKDLIEIPVSPREKERSLNEPEVKQLREAIGQLSWLATQTRPELCFPVSQLSSNIKSATTNDIKKANKLIRTCKATDVHLFFPKLNLESIKVKGYTDASYGKLNDGGSQGGLYIELDDGVNSSPIYWQSRKIQRIVDSAMAAETLAMKTGLAAAHAVSSLVSEILYDSAKPVEIQMVTDNRQLYETSYSTKSGEDRRLRRDISIIREYITKENTIITWVPTEEQLADVLTKDGVSSSTLTEHIKGKKVTTLIQF